MYQIENGVNVPERKSSSCVSNQIALACERLEIGQSFLIPKDGAPAYGTIKVNVHRARARTGWNLTVRKMDDGYRVFRLEPEFSPPSATGGGRPPVYPFADLTPGEYFDVFGDSGRVAAIRNYASQRGKKLGVRFKVMRIAGGCRVKRLY